MGRSLLPLSNTLLACIVVPVTIKAPVPASSVQAPASAVLANPVRPIASTHQMPNRLAHALTGLGARAPIVKKAKHNGVPHNRPPLPLIPKPTRWLGLKEECDRFR